MKKILTLALLGLLKISNAQLNNGLQACYPLDCDLSANYAATGSALDGTIFSLNCTTGHLGAASTAYEFAGTTSSYIKLPSDYRIQGDTVCFSGWFYIDALPTEQYLVYTANNCSSNFEAYSLITYYDASVSQQVFRVSKANASCTYIEIQSSSTVIKRGNWYHVVFYIDNAKIWLYVNNTLEASATHNISFDYNSSGKPVFLSGTNVGYWNWPFKGKMDDIRFYNRELTPAEISYLYNFSPDCAYDGTVERPLGLSANSSAKGNIKIYPNPSEGKFNVEGNAGNTIKVFDISGKEVVFNVKSTDSRSEIDLINAEAGFYFINVYDLGGNYLNTQKITVTK